MTTATLQIVNPYSVFKKKKHMSLISLSGKWPAVADYLVKDGLFR